MRRLLLIACICVVGSCQPEPQTATQALTLAPESMAQRQAQTRLFDTADENAILSASAALLQDLGFLIDETSGSIGLLVASKNRTAEDSGQVAGQVFLSLLAAAAGTRYDPVWEKDQKIRASVTVRRAGTGERTAVRVTFQRVVWNNNRLISRVETLSDAELYTVFFDRLAQSIFLEAHEL